MNWIKSIKNSRGGYDSFNWSIDTAVKVEATTFIVTLLTISLVCSIFGGYALLFYAMPGYKPQRVQLLWGGIIGSIVWILDYSLGIFNWLFWSSFPETYAIITTINIIILVLLIILLMFDDAIFNAFEMTTIPILFSWTLFTFLIYKLFPIFKDIFMGWITIAKSSIY